MKQLNIISKVCILYINISKFINNNYFINISYVNKNIFLGILDILKIMINDFNVLPCIDTISEYVLPFSFGEISYTKNLLIKYNVNETMFNNAYVLSLLRKRKLTEAATYSECKMFKKYIE